jgi:hypothetical protein
MSHLYVLASSSSFFAELGEHLFFFLAGRREWQYSMFFYISSNSRKKLEAS